MTILDRMRRDDIPINWSTILIGWHGPADYGRQLSIADIASHAGNLIEANPEQPECVLKLAGAQNDESEMVESCLKQLVAKGEADQNIELRKWRLYMLKDLEPTLGDDPVYGLIALTEFWDKFDYPKDSPHVVQARGNHQSPEEYYTDDNFRRLRIQHREWMKGEEQFLKKQKAD